MLFFETSAKTAEGVINMFYTSFSMIDFFDSIRKGNIDENLVNELIDQNVINKDNKVENKDKMKNNIIKNVNNDDDFSKSEILNDKRDKNINKDIKNKKDDNIIQIKIENKSNKNMKKKCNC